MNDRLERIGADRVGERWFGTYRDAKGRVAIVTHEAETEEQALAAAEAWVAKNAGELPPVHRSEWRESESDRDRWVVWRITPLDAAPVTLATPARS